MFIAGTVFGGDEATCLGGLPLNGQRTMGNKGRETQEDSERIPSLYIGALAAVVRAYGEWMNCPPLY